MGHKINKRCFEDVRKESFTSPKSRFPQNQAAHCRERISWRGRAEWALSFAVDRITRPAPVNPVSGWLSGLQALSLPRCQISTHRCRLRPSPTSSFTCSPRSQPHPITRLAPADLTSRISERNQSITLRKLLNQKAGIKKGEKTLKSQKTRKWQILTYR